MSLPVDDKPLKTVAWTMSVDTALEFFTRCQQRGAETEAERLEILVELASEGAIENVVATSKTKEEFIEDKAKHFKVLKIDKEGEHDADFGLPGTSE